MTHTSAVRDHLAECSSCRLVTELLDERRRGLDARDRQNECARFEVLIAAREEGTIGGTAGELLATHLRECADCAAVAATLVPADDRGSQSSLPAVSTSAYALGREVARGGMGRILEAHDVRIGRAVAVKELLGKSPALAARFEREARVTARLQHPGIVPIYEIGKWPDGTPFYAMRMVEGTTLREAIRDRKKLDERLALLPAMIAAAEAVAFAHGKRIIHRDLTPNNILVGAHGDTVVIDWGLAKDLSDPTEDVAFDPYRDVPAAGGNLTKVGAVIGTAAYMPPEQARGEAVDERADVYALGAILYQLLSGTAPYQSAASDEVVQRVQSGPPVAVAEVARDAPRDLISIVDKAMARDARERYRNANELVDELRRLQTGRLVEAHRYSPRERLRRWVGAHRGFAIGTLTGLAAVLVTGTIAVVGIVGQRDRAEAGERDAVNQRAIADRTNAELLEAQGREALDAGDPNRAAIWLSASYSAGNHRPSLRYLLGSAMRDMESRERELDCGENVTSLVTSPDKMLLLAACGSSLRTWRLDGTAVRTMTAPNARFKSAGFSHDGRRIVSRGPDGVARIWNTDTGAMERELVGHTAKLSGASFSADDSQILTSSADRTMRLWDSHSGSLIRTIVAAEPPAADIQAGLVANDRIVSIAIDGRVKVWDRSSGSLIRTIVPGGMIIGGDFESLSSSHRIVVCGLEGVAGIWDIETGTLVRSFSGHSEVAMTCKLSPDARLLVTTSNDHTAKVWNVDTGRLIQTMVHEGVVIDAVFSADEQTLVTVESSGVRVWDVATGALEGADDSGTTANGDVMQIVGDRIIDALDSRILIWRNLGRSRHTFHARAGSTIEGVNPEGTRAAIAVQGAVTVWNTLSNVPLHHEALHAPISQTGDFVAGLSGDGVSVINMVSGATVAHVSVAHAQNLELGAGAEFLLVRRDLEPSDAWNLRTRTLVKQWAAEEMPIGIATGGNRLIVWNTKQHVPAEIWALDSMQVVQRINADLGQFVWFTNNGQRLVIHQTGTGPLSIYDVTNGHELRTIPGVVAGGISPDGSKLVISRGSQLTVMRCEDGQTIGEVAWGMILGVMGVTNDGGFVAGSEAIKSTMEMVDPSVGGLVTLPYKNLYTLGDGSMQVGGQSAQFSPDENHLVMFGRNDLVRIDLTPELRSPEVIAKLVGDRAPFRVEHAQLVPKQRSEGIAALAGSITHDGVPVVGADVVVYGPEGNALASTHSSERGEFRLVGLPAGPIRLGAQSLAVGAFARPRAISLAVGANRADVEMDLAGSISGRVVDSAARPIANVHVHADCSGCEEQDAGDDTTHDDGTFTIRALMGGGSYLLKITGEHDAVLEAMPGQSPIPVKNGKDHVIGARVVVKPI